MAIVWQTQPSLMSSLAGVGRDFMANQSRERILQSQIDAAASQREWQGTENEAQRRAVALEADAAREFAGTQAGFERTSTADLQRDRLTGENLIAQTTAGGNLAATQAQSTAMVDAAKATAAGQRGAIEADYAGRNRLQENVFARMTAEQAARDPRTQAAKGKADYLQWAATQGISEAEALGRYDSGEAVGDFGRYVNTGIGGGAALGGGLGLLAGGIGAVPGAVVGGVAGGLTGAAKYGYDALTGAKERKAADYRQQYQDEIRQFQPYQYQPQPSGLDYNNLLGELARMQEGTPGLR